ncbi:MAG TPA: hypothetical protein VIL81_00350 [Candidatus Limnocylindrales bacterium]|jgi:hypothetical protein
MSLAASLALGGIGVGIVSAADPTQTETGIEAAATETESTGVEADGVGGHADAPGVDVNHEFNGEE